MKAFLNGIIVGTAATSFCGFIFLGVNAPSPVKNDFITEPLDHSIMTSALDAPDTPPPAQAQSERPNLQTAVIPESQSSPVNVHCDIGLINAIRSAEENAGKDSLQLIKEWQDEFSQEAIDLDWALPYQSDLENLVRAQDSLRNNLPDRIECKSERCLMSIRFYSPEERDEITETLLTAITENNLGIHPDTILSANDLTQSIEVVFNRSR